MREMEAGGDYRDAWQLDPAVDFLNHGSFGATPTCVLERQREFQDAMELEPVEFLGPERSLEGRLDSVRTEIARHFGANPEDLAFVRNATDGVNAVLRSFPFRPGDQVIVTNHGYNACNNAARYAAERAGAVVRVAQIPFPVTGPSEVCDAVFQMWSTRTRLLLIDHVTSPTALVLPISQIIEEAHERGSRVLIDGAHAPGMVPVQLNALGADYYTANHHKWICAPKSSGFLWVRPEWQDETRPTVISHAANRPRPGRSRFLAEFDWVGTYDPTPLLVVPQAIQFLSNLMPGGWRGLLEHNHDLAVAGLRALATALDEAPPAPQSMLGSMATIPLRGFDGAGLPAGPRQAEQLQQRLFKDYCVETPVFSWPTQDAMCLRISAQAYNSLDQYEHLASALLAERNR